MSDTPARMALTPLGDGVVSLQLSTAEQPYLEEGCVDALRAAVLKVATEGSIRAVLVEGGPKYFSAGASRATLVEGDAVIRLAGACAALPALLLDIPVPTVAAMAGHAIGGGLVMGLWCDAARLANESLYGANFVQLGLSPGMGSTRLLPEALGAPLAREMLFSGRLLKGRELAAAGALVHAIGPRDGVRAGALELARELAAVPAPAARALKSRLAARRRVMLAEALGAEQALHARLLSDPATTRQITDRYGR